ncbi:hypothetical protein VP01_2650g3 [Puccinia sorghi]|uniref:Uncharacterized protein n=1 Tax=Puccinia sorghi TaxID=27349 RepID=A0A0L6V4V5_9BASI|nr:hypothetical protein VP01_2650g3 [Puccinia sorghi]
MSSAAATAETRSHPLAYISSTAEGNTHNLLTDSNFPKDTRMILNRSPNIKLETTLKGLCTFVWQKLSNWILWFLSIPGIKSSIKDWCETVKNSPTDVIIDIQQGTAWKKISAMNNEPNPSNQLQFVRRQANVCRDHTHELYESPTNNAQQTLINLPCGHYSRPLRTQYDHHYTFDQAACQRTSRHEQLIHCRDPQAPWGPTCVVAGFASPSAKKFFSWCNAIKEDTSELKIGPPRHGANVQRISNNWLTVETHSGREDILRDTGIFYSELNLLEYRNPFKHVSLGMGFQTLSFKEKRHRGGGPGPSVKRCGLGGLFSEREMDYFCGALKNVVLPSIIGCIPMVCSVCIRHSAYFFRDLCQKHQRHQSSFKSMVDNGEHFIPHSMHTHCQHGDCFKSAYEKYNQSSIKIFEDLKVNPNHHYALHVPEKLVIWGPMGGVAEWSGEQGIGKFRSMETNKRLAQDSMAEFLASDLADQTNQKRRATKVDDVLYSRLLGHACRRDPTIQDYQESPHPLNAKILSPKQPNNCIEFKDNGQVRYGFVREIIVYKQPGEGNRVVCDVEKIKNSFCKVSRGPTKQFRFWLYLMKTVMGQPISNEGNKELLPVKSIENLTAYWWLPNGIFCLKNGVILTPVNFLASLQINLSNE